MAYGKIGGKLFVFFSCIILIECRNLLQLYEKEGGEVISKQFMPHHEGFDEFVAEYIGDDASVSELQRKTIIRGQLVSSSEAALDAMSPKLRCGDDLMRLQLSGPEVAQIELCRDNDSPVSLIELPPHCGQTISTNGGLVYATPYDGCGVMQQGGRYVMQIQWKGNSAVISCPMISATATETFLGPKPPTYLQILLSHSPPDTMSSTADPMLEPSTFETSEESTSTSQEMSEPQPPGYPQELPQRFWPYYYPHYHYPGMVYPTGPTTDPTVVQAPTQKPQQPSDSQKFWPYYYPHSHHHSKTKPTEKPVPTTIPTTTTVAQAPTQKPQFSGYPWGFLPYYYPHYHHGKPNPTEKPVPTTIPTTTSVAQTPTQKLELPGYPQGFWPYYWPYYHPHYNHGKPKPTEKPVQTSMPTTVVQAPTQKPQLPGYPQEFWQYYYPHYRHDKPKPQKPAPTSIPTTKSVAQAPTQNPQLPGYPQGFWQYYHPHDKPKPPKKPDPGIPTASPSSSPATTQKPQPPMYPGVVFPLYNNYPDYPFYLQQLYSQYPVLPPKTECKLFANHPPNEPPQYYIPPSFKHYGKDPFAFQFVDLSDAAADSFP